MVPIEIRSTSVRACRTSSSPRHNSTSKTARRAWGDVLTITTSTAAGSVSKGRPASVSMETSKGLRRWGSGSEAQARTSPHETT